MGVLISISLVESGNKYFSFCQRSRITEKYYWFFFDRENELERYLEFV